MRTLVAVSLLFLAVATHAAAPKVPSQKDLTTLTRESLLAFNKAVQAKEFTGFHKYISELWQEQITPEKLKSIFQTFIDQGLDLSAIAQAEPTFEPAPSIDADDVLIVEGHYPLAPDEAHFRLKYVNEKSRWKLIGIKLDVKPAGAADAKAPSVKEAKALVRTSLLDFNAALQEKSFAGLHGKIAPMWQKQITPEKMQSLFQAFIDGEVDISPIAKLEPSFERGPLIDEDGLLQIEGSYPTKPDRVRFALGYIFEGGEWRLLKINVRIGQPPGEASDE